MKNIIKKASLLTMLLLGIACISNAQVTVSFTLHIDDNATPIWTHDYCAQVYVKEGNIQHCVQQLTGLSAGPNLISYECELPYSESDPNYGIYCTVWRNGNPLFNGTNNATPLFFYQVTNGLTIITVAL